MSDISYLRIDGLLDDLTEFELLKLVGAVVGQLVILGNDTASAVAAVKVAADQGGEGSRLFDRIDR